MNKQNYIINNQLRVKLLNKNLFKKNLKHINLYINMYKLKSFNEDIILENMFLIEFLSSMKTSINTYKKGYQNYNIQIMILLREKYFDYLLNILKHFYFPLLRRRDSNPEFFLDKGNNYSFLLKSINELLFIPEIYFRNNYPIVCSIFLNSNSKKESNLLISYYSGFVHKETKLIN